MNKKVVGQLSLVALTFLWGTTFSFIKIVVRTIGFVYYVALRYGLATFLLTLIAFFNKKENLISQLKPGFILGILYFFGISLQGLGMEYTTASNAAFITGLSVVIVYAIEVFLRREKLSFKLALAVALSVFGLYFLSFSNFMMLNFGDIIVLAGAFFWALQIIAVGRYSRNSNIFYLLTFESFFTAISATLLFPLVEVPSIDSLIKVVFPLVYLSFFCTIIANALQLFGQKFVSNTEAAIIYLFEPVTAMLFSYITIGEQIGTNQIIGAISIMLAMAISSI
ncbi:MAG: DMT family transporter [Thermoproteota archaeon]|nr:DMT family transporter [Candidatus Brockarchaeota archaeon]